MKRADLQRGPLAAADHSNTSGRANVQHSTRPGADLVEEWTRGEKEEGKGEETFGVGLAALHLMVR